uniref:Uncharacterized protein n=1 Tax=Glossina brevipalpis TaxID=37001 RepID=A0A1A9W681_9MUSC
MALPRKKKKKKKKNNNNNNNNKKEFQVFQNRLVNSVGVEISRRFYKSQQKLCVHLMSGFIE